MTTQLTAYPLIKTALVELLGVRSGLHGVTVSYQAPEKAFEVLAQNGQRESLYFGGTQESSIDNVVFCDGGLRFDETYVQEVFVLVLGKDSDATQNAVDLRATTIVGELLGELSDQGSWDKAALGLDSLARLVVTPTGFDFIPGRLGDGPAHVCYVEGGLEVEARWRPPSSS